MANRKHQNNFGTNLTSNQIAGVTTTPLNSIPSVAAPFTIALDATNLNGKYEVVEVSSKTATNILHPATTYAHTTAEEVRMVVGATEMDEIASAANGGPINDTNGNEAIKIGTTASAVNEVTVTNAATAGTPDISPSGDDTNISMSMQGKGTGKVEVEMPWGSAAITSTSVTSATPADVTGATFSFTIKKTSHVKVTFNGNIQNNTAARYVLLRFMRDAAVIGDKLCHVAQSGTAASVTVSTVDLSLAAGTYTIKLQVASSNGSDTVLCSAGLLFAEAIIA